MDERRSEIVFHCSAAIEWTLRHRLLVIRCRILVCEADFWVHFIAVTAASPAAAATAALSLEAILYG